MKRYTPLASVFVLACASLLPVACGDSESGGGNGGTAGVTTSSVSASSSVTKAAASTTQGVTVTAANSTSTGMSGEPDGANCAADADCAGGFCLTEADFGFPGGQCSEDCTRTAFCTDAESLCLQLTQTLGACFRPCDPMTAGSCGMPDTLQCIGLSDGSGACLDGCTASAQCTDGRSCDAPVGSACVEPEVCGNGTNDNANREIDCEDGTCIADATCVADVATACTGAAVLALGANAGDTTMGTNDLSASCTGFGGANEVVYTFTPPANGDYVFHLASATDLGFFIRSTCTDVATEIGCRDAVVGGTDEVGFLTLTGGTPVTVVVDGFAGPAENGPFTLDVVARGCNDFLCDALPSEAPGGMSECSTCATDCTESPTCGFCIANGQCDNAEACTCNDCDAEPFCTDPANCTNDGFCEQFIEGCQCADCAAVPNCVD